MKAIRFVFCLFAALMLTTLNGLAAEEEDFKTFLQKFTSSASFQYSRIKFPLKSPIALLKDDGETEQTFPFTREKWALLDEETLKEGRTTEEEGGTYISHFTVNEPAHKEFEAGYDESEPSLRVVFELTDGKWYVTDCYNDWYNFALPLNELGGGALYGRHGSPKERFTEEYQEDLYIRHVNMLKRIPGLAGTTPWILKDFRSPRRHVPEIQDDFNRNGLVSDTGQKKKAFFVLQKWYKELTEAYK